MEPGTVLGVSDLDLGHLTPSDAVAALRSFPRRYREQLQPPLAKLPPGTDVDERAARRVGGGRAALEIVADVEDRWRSLGEALKQVVLSTEPTVDIDPGGEPGPAQRVAQAVIELEGRANSLANQIDQVSGDSWQRKGEVAGSGEEVTALDLVHRAVGIGRKGLDEVQATLASVDEAARQAGDAG